MKHLLIYLILIVLLVGCSGESKVHKKQSNQEAPEYITSQPKKVQIKLDLIVLRSGVKMYKTTHENAIPPDLKTLKETQTLKITTPLDEYNYDSTNGEITSKTYPKL